MTIALFPADAKTRESRALCSRASGRLPLIARMGVLEPPLVRREPALPLDPAQLPIVPDHYVTRMLVSQGHELTRLGVPRRDGGPVETDGRARSGGCSRGIHLLRGTPSRVWLDTTFRDSFGLTEPLTALTADACYDRI